MNLGFFISFLKDILILILYPISLVIGSLFSMPLFFDGTSYVITMGHLLVFIIAFTTIFGFIYSVLISKIGGGE